MDTTQRTPPAAAPRNGAGQEGHALQAVPPVPPEGTHGHGHGHGRGHEDEAPSALPLARSLLVMEYAALSRRADGLGVPHAEAGRDGWMETPDPEAPGTLMGIAQCLSEIIAIDGLAVPEGSRRPMTAPEARRAAGPAGPDSESGEDPEGPEDDEESGLPF